MDLSRSDKIYGTTISFFIGIILVIFGILFLLYNKLFYVNAINILLMIILFNGIFHMFKCIHSKRQKKHLFLALINIIFCIILLSVPEIPQSFFPILFSQYLFLYSVIKLIMVVIYFNNHIPGIRRELFISVVSFFFSAIIFLSPLSYIEILALLVGLYLIFLGFIIILSSSISVIPNRVKNKIKRKIRLRLPVWLEVLIPYTTLININKNLEVSENIKTDLSNVLNNIVPDMEVVVHVSNRGANKVGHVDLIYEDKVYSYGNYDDKYRKFYQIIGEGVLFVVDKKKYIPFCIKHSKKTLFSFGIKLSADQKKQIDNKFKEITSSVVDWYPPCTINMKEKCTDYCSCLYKSTNAKFYKFTSGKFKTYFVLGLSCCDIVNEFIGYSGIDFLKMNGIICPGAYLYRLNREYINNSGLVISRNIYTKETYKSLLKE